MHAVGIDFGADCCVVAAADGPHPRVLYSREGRSQIQSVVGQRVPKSKQGNDPSEILVGDAACNNWELAPNDTIVRVCDLLGRNFRDPEVQKLQQRAFYEIVDASDDAENGVCVIMGGKRYSPVDIASMIFRNIREDAEFHLGEPVTHAVIAVPAYFSLSPYYPTQRNAICQAASKAGLELIKLMFEPTAVAIGYGMGSPDREDVKRILVYNLRDGTFDASVLLWAGCTFAPLTIKGDMWLGGDNFDQALVEHAVKCIKREHGIDCTSNKRFMVLLKRKAQIAREHLSSARTAEFIIPGILKNEKGDPIDVDMSIRHDEWERLLAPVVNQSVEMVKWALADAGLKPDEIDHVLMAGNGTRVPLVQRAMWELFGQAKVLCSEEPSHLTALGAAVVARRLARLVCDCGHVNQSDAAVCEKCQRPIRLEVSGDAIFSDPIVPFHYGVQLAGDKFHVLIRKNDFYPTVHPPTFTYRTARPGQRTACVAVYGGEDLTRASANEKQGDVFAILPPSLPADTPVRIKMWLDADGVFDLSARLDDGTDLTASILKGGEDRKTIDAVEELQEWLPDKTRDLSRQKQAAAQRVLDEALDAVQKGDFDRALRVIHEFQLHASPPTPTSVTVVDYQVDASEACPQCGAPLRARRECPRCGGGSSAPKNPATASDEIDP